MCIRDRNIGQGRSYETEASIHNLSGEGLLLRDARFDISNMLPGEERRVHFTFDVNGSAAKDPEGAKIQLAIRDADLRESANERVVMAIRPPLTISKASGTFKAETAPIGLLEYPSVNAKPFGQLPKDGILGITGGVANAGADWLRVDLGQGRFAFVQKNAGKLGTGAPPPPPKPAKAVSSSSAKGKDVAPPSTVAQSWTDLLSHSPPAIEVDQLDLVTRTDKAKLKGFATDGDRILDVYVFVGARKIYYKSNKGSADPKKAGFELDLPLRPGVNYVSVWARESSETVQRRIFVIRRDGPNGELLDTPKSDDDVGELLGADHGAKD